MSKFYLTWLLLVTGFSFLLFALLLRIVDGLSVKLFLRIGLISFVLGLLTGAITLRNMTIKKKRKERRLMEHLEQGFS